MINVLKIKKLHRDVITPRYMTEGSAGFDIAAFLPSDRYEKQQIELKSGEISIVPTGLKFEIPAGFEAQVRPRSGLAFKNGIGIVNSPGTIDSDFRGEVRVCLINNGKDSFKIKNGDRIAQIVMSEVPEFKIDIVDELTETGRGQGGFGHTGR